jgi:flagellar biosynthesis chaperone FliJ
MFDFVKYLKNNRLTQTDKLSDRAKKFINEDYNPEIPDSDQKIGSSDKTSNRVGGVQSKLAMLKKKKDELVQKFTSGMIDIHQYKQMIGNIPQQIKSLQADLDRDTMEIGDDEDGMNEGAEEFTDFMLQSRKHGARATDVQSFISNMEELGYKLDHIISQEETHSDNPIFDFSWMIGLPKFKGINGPMKDGKTAIYADQEATDAYANESQLNEIEVEEESDLGQSVMKLAKMNDQIEILANELKKLEREYSELEKPIYSILEDLNTLHDDVDKSIKVGNQLIVSFKTKPTQVTNYKYKEAFMLLESKVNGAIRALVNEVKEANKSVSSRKGTVSVTKLNEAGIDVGKFDALANSFSDKVDSIHNIISKLTGSVA